MGTYVGSVCMDGWTEGPVSVDGARARFAAPVLSALSSCSA